MNTDTIRSRLREQNFKPSRISQLLRASEIGCEINADRGGSALFSTNYRTNG